MTPLYNHLQQAINYLLSSHEQGEPDLPEDEEKFLLAAFPQMYEQMFPHVGESRNFSLEEIRDFVFSNRYKNPRLLVEFLQVSGKNLANVYEEDLEKEDLELREVPEFIKQFISLKTLAVQGPIEIFSLNLEELPNLSSLTLKGHSISDFSFLKKAHLCELSFIRKQEQGPGERTSLHKTNFLSCCEGKSLLSLTLKGERIDQNFLKELFTKAPYLSYLDLSQNKFPFSRRQLEEEKEPGERQNLNEDEIFLAAKSLETLKLSNCAIMNLPFELFTLFLNTPKLQHLDLSNNPGLFLLEGEGPEDWLDRFPRMPELKKLNLSVCNLHDSEELNEKLITKFPNLKEVVLDKTSPI